MAYTMETVLAEKYENIIRRKIGNTRAGDFYDLHILYHERKDKVRPDILKMAIEICEEKHMIRIRPYKTSDVDTILSWCQDEKAFYQWTAGILGNYPITQKEFCFVEALMPFTAFDETGIVGFFTLRNPDESFDELRFGFVIVNPHKRGKGYGKAMLQLGLKFAFDMYGAKKISLGVFENNLPAYYCYKAVGFSDVALDTAEKYYILDEEWKCKELIMENR